MYQAQAKLLDLAAYTQPNLHMVFVPGDGEKALHFRTQGEDVLGNAWSYQNVRFIKISHQVEKYLKASLKEKMSQNNSRMELEWKQTENL